MAKNSSGKRIKACSNAQPQAGAVHKLPAHSARDATSSCAVVIKQEADSKGNSADDRRAPPALRAKQSAAPSKKVQWHVSKGVNACPIKSPAHLLSAAKIKQEPVLSSVSVKHEPGARPMLQKYVAQRQTTHIKQEVDNVVMSEEDELSEDGFESEVEYDSDGNTIQYDSDGEVIRYDRFGCPVEYDSDGCTVEYDSDGNVVKYDSYGNPIEYDSDGNELDSDGIPKDFEDEDDDEADSFWATGGGYTGAWFSAAERVERDRAEGKAGRCWKEQDEGFCHNHLCEWDHYKRENNWQAREEGLQRWHERQLVLGLL